MISSFLGLEELKLWECHHSIKSDIQGQWNSYRNSNGNFQRNRKKYSKTGLESQMPQLAKEILRIKS